MERIALASTREQGIVSWTNGFRDLKQKVNPIVAVRKTF